MSGAPKRKASKPTLSAAEIEWVAEIRRMSPHAAYTGSRNWTWLVMHTGMLEVQGRGHECVPETAARLMIKQVFDSETTATQARWAAVCFCRDTLHQMGPGRRRLTWPKAYLAAAALLKGTWRECGDQMMKKAYGEWEAGQSSDLRRRKAG